MKACRVSMGVAVLLGGLGVAASADTVTMPPAPAVGLSQDHHFQDWVVACDNVRRCEAQGYPAQESNDPPVMLRVRREAGPEAPVRLSLAWGNLTTDARQKPPPQPRAGQPLTLKAGTLSFSWPVPVGYAVGSDVALPVDQGGPLLAAMRQADALDVTQGALRWRISLKGASAALLKLDDLQGRVGTVGALARPGPQAEDRVPVAPALPQIDAVRIPAGVKTPEGLKASLLKAVLALPAVGERCDRLHPENLDAKALLASTEVWPLSDSQVMVTLPCWLAAYNGGSAAWVAHIKPPHALKDVRFAALPAEGTGRGRAWMWEDSASDLGLKRQADGVLLASAMAKGRGDCVSRNRWAWNGQAFVLLDSELSACKFFSSGGEPLRLWRAQVR